MWILLEKASIIQNTEAQEGKNVLLRKLFLLFFSRPPAIAAFFFKLLFTLFM